MLKRSLSQRCLASARYTFQGQEIRTTQTTETVHLKQSLQVVPSDLLNSDPYPTQWQEIQQQIYIKVTFR